MARHPVRSLNIGNVTNPEAHDVPWLGAQGSNTGQGLAMPGGAPLCGRSEDFSKNPAYYCSFASGLQYQSKKVHLIPIPAVPQQKTKKSLFANFRTVFNQIVGTLRFPR